MTAFEQYVRQLAAQHKGERIFSFSYENKCYWLKQPEQVKGMRHLLKPGGEKSFQHELNALKKLNALKAPVSELVLWGEDFLVLKDVGRTANQWIEDETESAVQKQKVLNDCAQALANLHKQNIIHGRPALRDIAWQNGQVRFLDLESIVHSDNLRYGKLRDVLVFTHGMFRSKLISDEQVKTAMDCYLHEDNQGILLSAANLIYKFRWLYYVLLPFKPVAKMDLIALYRLFEFAFAQNQLEKTAS